MSSKQQSHSNEKEPQFEKDTQLLSPHKSTPSDCRPPKGMTYLTIGQDLVSIHEYILSQYNQSLHHETYQNKTTKKHHPKSSTSWKPTHRYDDYSYFFPAAVMVYTDLSTLHGLDQPVDYGSGIQYADGLLDSLVGSSSTFHKHDSSPQSLLDSTLAHSSSSSSLTRSNYSMGLQIGLWLNGTFGCQQILQGQLDTQIDTLYHYIHKKSQSLIVFLRIGYEFDNPFFGYSSDPTSYVQAYQYIVHRMRRNQEVLLAKKRTTTTSPSNHMENSSSSSLSNSEKIQKKLLHLEQDSHAKSEKHTGHHDHHHPKEKHTLYKIQLVWHSWAAPISLSNEKDILDNSLNDPEEKDRIDPETHVNHTSKTKNKKNQSLHTTTTIQSTKKPSIQFQHFYPGDEYVDWVGVSIFQQLFPWNNQLEDHRNMTDNYNNKYSWAGSIRHVENVLDFAQAHDKPIMIAESTPFGGIDMMSTDTIAYNVTDPWERWFQPVLSLIDKYDIGMWSYIDCDWDAQPMWRGVGFGDTRIASNQYVMEKWQDWVTNSNRFDDGRRRFLSSISRKSIENCNGFPEIHEISPVSKHDHTNHKMDPNFTNNNKNYHTLSPSMTGKTSIKSMEKPLFSNFIPLNRDIGKYSAYSTMILVVGAIVIKFYIAWSRVRACNDRGRRMVEVDETTPLVGN